MNTINAQALADLFTSPSPQPGLVSRRPNRTEITSIEATQVEAPNLPTRDHIMEANLANTVAEATENKKKTVNASWLGPNYQQNMAIYRVVAMTFLRQLFELPFNTLAVDGLVGVMIYNHDERNMTFMRFDDYIEMAGQDVVNSGRVIKMTRERWEEINGVKAPRYVMIFGAGWFKDHNDLEHPVTAIASFINASILQEEDGSPLMTADELEGFSSYYQSKLFMERIRQGY